VDGTRASRTANAGQWQRKRPCAVMRSARCAAQTSETERCCWALLLGGGRWQSAPSAEQHTASKSTQVYSGGTQEYTSLQRCGGQIMQMPFTQVYSGVEGRSCRCLLHKSTAVWRADHADAFGSDATFILAGMQGAGCRVQGAGMPFTLAGMPSIVRAS